VKALCMVCLRQSLLLFYCRTRVCHTRVFANNFPVEVPVGYTSRTFLLLARSIHFIVPFGLC
jgi:hypothetical protein